MTRFFKASFPLLAMLASCKKNSAGAGTPLSFDSIPTAKPLKPLIAEISGIAASNTVPQHLWGHEDSGNPPQLYLINIDGNVTKKVYLKGAVNRDWEDIALSGGDLYLADIGDNNRVFSAYTIYKFREPGATADTISNFETIRFRYADGAHDAEALLVEPVTKAIFIITKNNNPAGVYKVPFPYSTTEPNTAVKVAQLAYSGVVSAALSPDATEIIVKTYTKVYYYQRNGQALETALQATPVQLPYRVEPQGEAVTFATDKSGFFTLSEKGMFDSVNLYFYKRR